MAKGHRRTSSRRRRGPTSEHWLLILGAAVLVAVACGSVVRLPWPFAASPPLAPLPLTPEQARRSNDAVPFVTGANVPAKRYTFVGGPAARAQAIDCLATVALYEAGDDRAGQRAVIQVVLNRVRAPGFPKTVCGVVYQGSERTTGCQFSFACDGSVTRRPERSGWLQVRRAAARALGGYVDRSVGRATHYHTDWIVPYWRSSLDKVAQVKSHIFYRKACRHC